MSATTCPNCGKPLRPGAKFCGSCGATLPAGPPPRAAAAATPPNSVACPHCGKPVRPDAKFCSNCGKVIEAAVPEKLAATLIEPASPGQAPTLQGLPPASPPGAPAAPTLQGRPGATGETARPAIPPPAPAKPRRRGLALGLLAVVLAGCALLLVGSYVAATRMGLLSGFLGAGDETASPAITVAITTTVTQTPVQVSATPTQTSVVTPTLTTTPTTAITPTVALPTASPFVTPTLGLVLGASPTIEATEAPPQGGAPAAPTSGVPGAGAPGAPVPSQGSTFEDLFDRQLSENWVTWGSPVATIDSGFNDRWMSLKAEDPNAGGVTTGQSIRVVNAPGTAIEFEGQLDPRYLNFAIVMNWDQEDVRRGADFPVPGVIHVQVRAEVVSVITPLTAGACQAQVDASRSHVYRIEVLEGQGVLLSIDGSPTACTIPDMGLAALPGRLSFSGLGWVTRVKVTQGP